MAFKGTNMLFAVKEFRHKTSKAKSSREKNRKSSPLNPALKGLVSQA
jgi:hypothetical protein